MPPCTIKRRTTTNLKIKYNQNCQKIKLHGSLTTKELKKKHSSRLVGGAETLQARRGWKKVFKVMKGKDLHPRLFYPAKLSFRIEGQIKCFPDKVKLKESIIIKPLLYEMLKGLI